MQCPAFLLSFCAMFSHAKFVVPFYVVTMQITYSLHEHLFTYEPITFLLQLCKAGGKNNLIFFFEMIILMLTVVHICSLLLVILSGLNCH